jgi:hypothetical protein
VIVIRTLSERLVASSVLDALLSVRTTVFDLPALSENLTDPSDTFRALCLTAVTAKLLTV